VPGVGALAARLATVQGLLGAAVRARGPEELLARAVRQIGLAKALSLLPGPAAPILRGLGLVARTLADLTRDR
jgi:hypothetical protein